MGIVIHEFDIVAEAQPTETQAAAPAPPAPVTVLDIKRAAEHAADRSARVWAH